MRSMLFVLMSVLSLSLMTIGCAGPKAASEPLTLPGELAYEELDTQERFRKYDSVCMMPFSTEGVVFLSTNAEEKPEMESFARSANDFLIKGFLDEMKDNYYKRFGSAEKKEDAKKYDLIITGKFIEFERGNAAGRFWGVGGATRVTVEGVMTETATGKEIARFRDFKIGTGSLGSIFLLQNNCTEVGGNISDFLEEVY